MAPKKVTPASAVSREVLRQVHQDLFDRAIISNLYRAEYVERLITHYLGERYRHVGSDWSGWDIQRDDGLRIEVKQSAARQTWGERPGRKGKPTNPVFDIAARTGYWKDGGTQWHAEPGRPAHVYIFAWHPRHSPIEEVDHRDPEQWEFYVVPTSELPDGKSLSGRKIFARWHAVRASELRRALHGLQVAT